MKNSHVIMLSASFLFAITAHAMEVAAPRREHLSEERVKYLIQSENLDSLITYLDDTVDQKQISPYDLDRWLARATGTRGGHDATIESGSNNNGKYYLAGGTKAVVAAYAFGLLSSSGKSSSSDEDQESDSSQLPWKAVGVVAGAWAGSDGYTIYQNYQAGTRITNSRTNNRAIAEYLTTKKANLFPTTAAPAPLPTFASKTAASEAKLAALKLKPGVDQTKIHALEAQLAALKSLRN